MKAGKFGKLALWGIILLGAGGLVYGCSGKEESRYETQKLERGKIIQKITASGIINPISTVNIGTQVSGSISEIFVDYNSAVKKGQLLAQIDPALFEATVANDGLLWTLPKPKSRFQKTTLFNYKKHLEQD